MRVPYYYSQIMNNEYSQRILNVRLAEIMNEWIGNEF